MDKKSAVLIFLISVIGIALRLFSVGATDLSGDEAFFVMFAYKIAFLMWSNPLLVLLAFAFFSVVVFFVVLRQSLIWTTLIVWLALVAKFVLGLPYLTHSPGPGLILSIASMIYFTGFPPQIAGELVSTLALIGLVFVGLWIGSRWNKNVGLLAFALLMFSPYSVFMSGTSFLGPLGWFLCFLSFALFLKAQDDDRFLPLAGLVACLAFATRFPTMVLIPVFVAMAYVNRQRLSKKNLAIFFILIFGTVAFFAPLALEQYSGSKQWHSMGGSERWDLIEANMSSFVEAGTATDVLSSQDSTYIFRLMSLFYSPMFLALLILAILFALYSFFVRRDWQLAGLLFVGLTALVCFWSLLHHRANRGLGFGFPFVMLVSYLIFCGKNYLNVRKLVAVLLVFVFLSTSLYVVSVHNFKGISGFAESVPDDAVVFIQPSNIIYRYYRNFYLYDLSVDKPLLNKFFVEDVVAKQMLEEKRLRLLTEFERFDEADFALVGTIFDKDLYENKLVGFEQCESVWNNVFEMFYVYAKNEIGCGGF